MLYSLQGMVVSRPGEAPDLTAEITEDCRLLGQHLTERGGGPASADMRKVTTGRPKTVLAERWTASQRQISATIGLEAICTQPRPRHAERGETLAPLKAGHLGIFSQAYFADANHRRNTFFEPGLVYTFHIFQVHCKDCFCCGCLAGRCCCWLLRKEVA